MLIKYVPNKMSEKSSRLSEANFLPLLQSLFVIYLIPSRLLSGVGHILECRMELFVFSRFNQKVGNDVSVMTIQEPADL